MLHDLGAEALRNPLVFQPRAQT
eukprot:SAG31_NODE_12415_length_944_cov_0.679290_1_plen_22_part_10